MKKYAITLSVSTTIFVDSENPTEAKKIALNEFEAGKKALISEIELSGYEVDYDDELTEEE